MVRITTNSCGADVVLNLEGRLTGAWVAELEECWRVYAALPSQKHLVVDLTHTEFVDLAGKYLLTLMHRSGVGFIAGTPYMKALLAEIAANGAGIARPAVNEQAKGPQQ
jgi:hypothetical protein